MGKAQSGDRNPFWKGGRVIASNGYVLIRVGKDHHLADVRGYAYEHRVVAEQKIGRRLAAGEQVHHVDGNPLNNDPSNLEVMGNIAEHMLEHRAPGGIALRMPGEPNRAILCGCGCGTEFPMFDDSGRPRLFVAGHNSGQSGESEAEVIRALAQGPLHREDIARITGRDVHVIASRLTKLKHKGIAVNDKGQWRIGKAAS